MDQIFSEPPIYKAGLSEHRSWTEMARESMPALTKLVLGHGESLKDVEAALTEAEKEKRFMPLEYFTRSPRVLALDGSNGGGKTSAIDGMRVLVGESKKFLHGVVFSYQEPPRVQFPRVIGEAMGDGLEQFSMRAPLKERFEGNPLLQLYLLMITRNQLMHRIGWVMRGKPEVFLGGPVPEVLDFWRGGDWGVPWTALADRCVASSMVHQATYLSRLTGQGYEAYAEQILRMHMKYSESSHILLPDALLVLVPEGDRNLDGRGELDMDVHEGQMSGDEERAKYTKAARMFELVTGRSCYIVEQGPERNSLGLLIVAVGAVLNALSGLRSWNGIAEMNILKPFRAVLEQSGRPILESDVDLEMGDFHVSIRGDLLRLEVVR